MKIQKMSAICAGLACAAVSSFAEELTVAEGSPVTLTSHQQYSAINLYDKLTVGVGGRVLVSPPPPITILGDKGGIVKDGGALPGQMTITIPATGGTFSDGAIVDVTIGEDHQIVRSGPYRWLRHPSYTGALATFLGFALCQGDGISLLIILIPVFAVFLRRIHIEEAALAQAFPIEYPAYARQTRRLLPGIW